MTDEESNSQKERPIFSEEEEKLMQDAGITNPEELAWIADVRKASRSQPTTPKGQSKFDGWALLDLHLRVLRDEKKAVSGAVVYGRDTEQRLKKLSLVAMDVLMVVKMEVEAKEETYDKSTKLAIIQDIEGILGKANTDSEYMVGISRTINIAHDLVGEVYSHFCGVPEYPLTEEELERHTPEEYYASSFLYNLNNLGHRPEEDGEDETEVVSK